MNRLRRLFIWLLLFLFLVWIWIKVKNEVLRKENVPTITSSVKFAKTTEKFRRKLIKEHLKSYSTIYDDKRNLCRDKNDLDEDQKSKFARISQIFKEIRQQIPEYPKSHFSGRGIVLTGGSIQFSFMKINLQMIQLTSTRLPIEIWFSRSQISREQMKELFHIVPQLNLSLCSFDENQCESRRGIFKINPSFIYKPKSETLPKVFPFKPSAILSSTFSEVLFLDCDAYLTRDPEELFRLDPMYEKFGALLYPDAYKTRQHPYLWKLLNSSCAENEYEIDSGTILVNKVKVWKGLYATKLINDHHQMFYDFVTDGDKDTFRIGFRLMKVKYYLVMIPCATGEFRSKRFCGHALCKTDSLAQHIYVNHAHIFKHEFISYSKTTLGYTRIGLADPNKNPFVFLHCRLNGQIHSCFHILNTKNGQQPKDQCYQGEIPSNEIELHRYSYNETLLHDESRRNRVLISETNFLMPSFVENLIGMIKSNTNGWS